MGRCVGLTPVFVTRLHPPVADHSSLRPAWLSSLGKKILTWILYKCTQELADAVIAEQLKGVQYKSTDRVMKYSEFQQLCQRIAPPESVSVLECYMQSQRLVAKERTKSGLEVSFLCHAVEPLYCMWTPWRPGEVPCVERCPHFGVDLY